uniref:Natural cytotoxicity triggering receptor 1 n=1 Tax=Mandrillus leucophaeus TaxID=9568 RepID=A0A2K6AJL4_MANLE
MPSTLRALLCLGLCLSQRISAPKQTLPKPIIRAESTYMVPKEKQATLCCQGSYGAVEYQLHFEGSLFAVERPKPPERINGVKFHIPDMNSRKAGRYSCIYRVGELWSERSDLLDLVVTADSWDTCLLTTETGLQKDLALWDHTAQNLLRMGLAFLVLVALVCLLVEDWLSRKRTREQASRASTWEGRRRLNTKTL